MKKFITVILFGVFFVSLQANAQALSCQTPQEKVRCQAEYDALQKEIADWQKVLDETKSKKNTLQGDVTILNAQIAKAEKEIKQRNITVTTLSTEISQKVTNINSLEARIEKDKNLLANLLKKKNQNEVEPIFYLLFSSADLSSFIVDIDNVQLINSGLQDLFVELQSTKDQTQKEKESLDIKKNQELDAKYEVELKKKTISQNQADKKELLSFTTKAESNYQQANTC